VSAADDPQRSAEHPGDLVELETLISDLSSRFINLPPGDVDREIEDAMRRVCEPLGIDFATLWQWSREAQDTILPTHAYPPQKAVRAAEPLHQDLYPWVVHQMRAGRMVVSVRWRSCRRRPRSTGRRLAVRASSPACAFPSR